MRTGPSSVFFHPEKTAESLNVYINLIAELDGRRQGEENRKEGAKERMSRWG